MSVSVRNNIFASIKWKEKIKFPLKFTIVPSKAESQKDSLNKDKKTYNK